MNNDNAEQLKKLAKVFNTDNIITPKEIESVLTAITKILASFKKQNQELNDETKAVLNVLFDKISDEHNRSLQALSDKNDKTLEEVSKSKKDIDAKITKALSKLEQTVQEVLAMKPENGKDADEEKIVEDVLSKIILPEYKETVLDGGEEIVEKINSLSLTPENQIDASHIKNLPTFSGGKFGKAGTRYLKDLVDVNLDGLTITDGKYDLGSGSGGGGGGSSFNDQTPNTDASYGTLAGDVDGANTTFTVSEGEYLTGKLKVYLNGQLQEQNSTGDWVETTPASGTFDFLVAPTIGDTVTASYETVASSGGIQSVVAGTNVTVDNTDPLNPIVSATGGGGGGAVDSVNGQTGVVVLDADDIDDTSTTNKFVTAGDLTKLSNLSGTNTGDVTVTDSSEIDFSLTGQDITASLIAGSIDETKLDASVNASLDLADSALQSANISDTAYDATSWNAVTTIAPSKNAVRDKIDAMDTTISSKLDASAYDDATSAETNTGTSTAKYVSPDGLAGSVFGTKEVIIPVFLYDYAVTTGDGKVYVTLPSTLNGMNLVDVRANLGVAPSTSGTPTIQIARGRRASATSALSFVDVLSTRITIDANEYDSKDATTPAVIDTANDDIATGDVYRIDYDVAGTGAKGTDIICLFRLP